MYIPKREQVEEAFHNSSSLPLLVEMERRFDAWDELRKLKKRWDRLAKRGGIENSQLLVIAGLELENILDGE